MHTASLGDLVSIQTGKLDANASSPDGAYPFFTCAREPLRIANWKYDLDAVLVAGNGDLNVKHYKGKFDAYQRTYIISPKNETAICTRYLFYFMDSYLETLREQSIGGIIKYIKMGMLTDAKIPLPPLEEQIRIAAILDQADDTRRKRSQAVDMLNQLGQAIFYEMFGDPFAFKGANGSVILKSLVNRITYGFTSPMSHHGAGIPILTAKSVQDGYIDYSTCSYANREDYDKLTDKCKPDKGDILVTKDGTIGRCSIFDGETACINQSVCLIKPNYDLVTSKFLASYIRFSSVQKRIEAMKKGNAIAHLQITEFANFPIVCPPMAKQKEFEDRLALLANAAIHAGSGLQSAHELFISLQHRTLTGQL